MSVYKNRRGLFLAAAIGLTVSAAAVLNAQSDSSQTQPQQTRTTAQTATTARVKLSLDQAILRAVDNSSDLMGAGADVRAADARALAAKLRFIPGISASASYTKLSDLPASNLKIGAISVSLPASPTDAISAGFKLQYPVFTGFRLLEAANIADLQTTGKKLASEMIQRALRFETTRAYWECLRAAANVNMLIKNRDVVKSFQSELADQVSQGLATSSDQLAADQRFNAAEIALNDAFSFRNQAYMALATVIGDDAAAQKILSDTLAGLSADAIELPFDLDADIPALVGQVSIPAGNLSDLIAKAQAERPEAKSADLGKDISDHAIKAAAGGLYPTVTVYGDYTYANPNSRVFPANGDFTGTWSIGAQVTLDIGGIPGTIAQMDAATQDLEKAKAQYKKTLDGIASDVRNTAIAVKRNFNDLELSNAAVKQGQENLRVQSQKFDVGLIKHSDLLDAQLGLLRAQFGVTNKQIDTLISWADFTRATGQ